MMNSVMAKIHTHYDNLKVARAAPPEVIRAAYKALSQKYHPDKNPGDEKAARIMAILNSAYGTLADTQRRKEHDEWISAEEWEIEWLESTRLEEGKDKHRNESTMSGWAAEKIDVIPYRRSRDPKWWMTLLGCVGIGWLGAVLVQTQSGFLPLSLSHASNPKPLPLIATPAVPAEGEETVETKVVSISQIRLPASSATCDSAARAPTAPNGQSWPVQSGYIAGYLVGNRGGNTQLIIDNSKNDADVAVSLYDALRNQAVRQLLVARHDKFTIDHLNAGNYEVKYEALGIGALAKAACDALQKPERDGSEKSAAPAPASAP
jgi:hypothetical protein